MPSVTTTLKDLEKDGPILEVYFLIPSELEKKYIEEKIPIPEPVIVKALIDTGASACAIKREIPERLGLKPTGVTNISTPSSTQECYQYFIRMVIPSHQITYQGVFIAAPMETGDVNCLIGRDVLKSGILIYIGYTNQFTLSLL